MYTTLIRAEQLQTLLTSGRPTMVFDCSFELMQPSEGHQQYLASHIAGAQRADLDQHLSAKPPAPAVNGGRHPLPTRETFATWLASLGFTADMQAVVYDRQGANYCGRLWWMLKWVGHEAVAVLDGGLQAWQALGGALASGPAPAVATPSHFQATVPVAELMTAERLLQQLDQPTLTVVDARPGPRFRGEVEPLDPVAGHIPGALNRPFTQNLGPDGCFKPAEVLRAEFLTLLGARNPQGVVHQCGSGVSAVPNLLAMEVAGLGRGALYAGSWSEWCRDPQRPVAQG